jgi:hypothetical protein
MPDYSKAKIYTIRCRTDNTSVYVGSTVQSLACRFSDHKRRSDTSLYKHIKNKCNSDWSNWYIELYEEFPCENKEQLQKREGEVIRSIGTVNRYMLIGLSFKERVELFSNDKDKYLYYSSKSTELRKLDLI